MKSKKRIEARKLRVEGLSIKEISEKLKVAKSSVSVWVRDIKLDFNKKKILALKGNTKEIVEKRRLTRLNKEKNKRDLVVEAAKKEIKKINKRELWLLGVALYCAEGGKTDRSLVRFSNSDPEMIKIMMEFFRKICLVPEKKFRCYIHIYSHLNVKSSEKYWSKITKVKLSQFFKTYCIRSKAGKHKRDNLPNGTLDVYVCDTNLFLKISGWSAGMFGGY
ncbi:MAG: hypothetical protein US58_C0011G0008 [Candidatus Magasanikbacteria bacterium GW2011_GWA2_37_8]|uniref:Uncharacterized protein n=1 Tax=Candidatus Magasanikbacteria bacterium GW2011_GWA2_37_8 TaxID=1619036 RepID=A0A0G0KJV4_9BACT|nr:MAG: hypothetical protein US58_C0011G0008 [Candidatus Magasanikbacteria bacterium GW2011_GWA2_37_8]